MGTPRLHILTRNYTGPHSNPVWRVCVCVCYVCVCCVWYVCGLCIVIYVCGECVCVCYVYGVFMLCGVCMCVLCIVCGVCMVFVCYVVYACVWCVCVACVVCMCVYVCHVCGVCVVGGRCVCVCIHVLFLPVLCYFPSTQCSRAGSHLHGISGAAKPALQVAMAPEPSHHTPCAQPHWVLLETWGCGVVTCVLQTKRVRTGI